MRTVSRCNPNVRAASRMLIPSTITALRIRRYTSTLYIRCITRWLYFEAYGWRWTVRFATAVCQRLPAHVAQYISAAYKGMVDYVRRNFLVPIPSFESFDALNAHLERRCLERMDATLRGHSESIGQRMERDLDALPHPEPFV